MLQFPFALLVYYEVFVFLNLPQFKINTGYEVFGRLFVTKNKVIPSSETFLYLFCHKYTSGLI